MHSFTLVHVCIYWLGYFYLICSIRLYMNVYTYAHINTLAQAVIMKLLMLSFHLVQYKMCITEWQRKLRLALTLAPHTRAWVCGRTMALRSLPMTRATAQTRQLIRKRMANHLIRRGLNAKMPHAPVENLFDLLWDF